MQKTVCFRVWRLHTAVRRAPAAEEGNFEYSWFVGTHLCLQAELKHIWFALLASQTHAIIFLCVCFGKKHTESESPTSESL